VRLVAFPRWAWALALGAAFAAGPGFAQSVCDEPQGTVSEAFQARSLAANLPQADELADETESELATRATSDGLAGNDLDLIRRAFVALNLGTIQDEDKSLVFNFNPDALHLDSFGQFSPRVVVREPTLFTPISEAIDELDEDERQKPRDTLTEGLGDLDDVEVSVRWTPHAMEPATDLQEVAGEIFTDATSDDTGIAARQAGVKRAIAEALPRDLSDDPFLATVTVAEACANATARAAFEAELDRLSDDVAEANEALSTKLGDRFFRLADLVEGEPRLVVNLASRQRADAAGPDETTLNVTWQRGWLSYRGAKKAGGGTLTVDGVDQYFASHGRLKDALPLLSLVAEYTSTGDLRVDIPGIADPFVQDGGHKLSAKVSAGTYFGGGRDRRLELSATYDDVSGDPLQQDRMLAQLTWTEQLGEAIAQAVGGSEFVVSLIYANKPQYRGEVDEDLGLRAGLKWSLGKASDKK
jgi:hypothetical protein